MAVKAKNTMKTRNSRWLIFTTFILSLSLFFTFFFEPLGGITAGQSVYIFLILQFGFSLSATILLYKKNRTALNAVIVVLLPQFIYRGLSTRNAVLSIVGVALLWLFSLAFFCESFFRRKDPLEKLSDEERLDVLNCILKMETKHLGITLPIELIISRKMPEDTLGSYHPADGTIEINQSDDGKTYRIRIYELQILC